VSEPQHIQPDCPSCGQSLRGLSPMPPALLLRCPECGHVTTVQKIAERHVEHRRSTSHLLLWATLLLLALAAVLFHRAVMNLGG
jgi:predicted RNA-binding Zn-ribbon protein involved in translation (DUF1610 family)